MIVWIDGALNVMEIRDKILSGLDRDFQSRLIEFLDDTISTCVPTMPDEHMLSSIQSHSVYETEESNVHPCCTRGVDMDIPHDVRQVLRQRDLSRLAKLCQTHAHTATCYKYCKPGETRECRFGLDANNVIPFTIIDPDTGSICLRCLDGLVNNFNATILEAIRCNMDLKFLASGDDAKAVIFYITDYITKTQLSAHVAYAALEIAIKRLGEFNPSETERMTHAKRLLQKCAFAMLTHQELSAQEVASYLLDLGDHFTSHDYANLFWLSFEKYVNDLMPSPECYGHPDEESHRTIVQPTEDEQNIPGYDTMPPNDIHHDDGADGDEISVINRLFDENGELRKKA